MPALPAAKNVDDIYKFMILKTVSENLGKMLCANVFVCVCVCVFFDRFSSISARQCQCQASDVQQQAATSQQIS